MLLFYMSFHVTFSHMLGGFWPSFRFYFFIRSEIHTDNWCAPALTYYTTANNYGLVRLFAVVVVVVYEFVVCACTDSCSAAVVCQGF